MPFKTSQPKAPLLKAPLPKAPLVLAVTALLAQPAFADAPPDFQGRYIAAISDADMRAYAYIDGDLGTPRGNDQLAIVSLPLTGDTPTGVAEVSNSVINPVFSIAASPDGNTIFVAETRKPRAEGDRTIQDLESGTTLRAVDVSDPAQPRIIDSIEVGIRPQGVSVSPDGSTLVLATKAPEAPLVFVSYDEGGFGRATASTLKGFTAMPELPDQGMLPHHAEWHPTEDIVAVMLAFRAQLQFYRVERRDDGSVAGIEPWGNRVLTSKWPMSGKFSPDGRYFVTNDLHWGADVRGIYLNAPPSRLTVTELAPLDAQEPRHFIVGGVSLPRHAESFAFSNDGTMIATLNIGQTWLEDSDPRYSRSSLSLVGFDPKHGLLDHTGTWEFDGILPEGIAFDASDSYVVAGVFEYEGPEPRRSALEFWRVDRSAALPRLQDTGFAVETGPGAHSLIVVN